MNLRPSFRPNVDERNEIICSRPGSYDHESILAPSGQPTKVRSRTSVSYIQSPERKRRVKAEAPRGQ